MSQLRASRRKDDFTYYLDLSAPTETQMKNVVRGEERERDPKLGLLFAALLMFAIFVGGLVYAILGS